MIPLNPVTWRAITDLLANRLVAARDDMERAASLEAMWRAQGKVQALRDLQNLEEQLKLLAKVEAA